MSQQMQIPATLLELLRQVGDTEDNKATEVVEAILDEAMAEDKEVEVSLIALINDGDSMTACSTVAQAITKWYLLHRADEGAEERVRAYFLARKQACGLWEYEVQELRNMGIAPESLSNPGYRPPPPEE